MQQQAVPTVFVKTASPQAETSRLLGACGSSSGALTIMVLVFFHLCISLLKLETKRLQVCQRGLFVCLFILATKFKTALKKKQHGQVVNRQI